MSSVYAVTDPGWIRAIRSLPNNGPVAFWQPTPGRPHRIEKGEPWFFKQRGRPEIVGYGIFAGWEKLAVRDLFRKYGFATGSLTEGELVDILSSFNKKVPPSTIVGNVVLEGVTMFPLPKSLASFGLDDLSIRFRYIDDKPLPVGLVPANPGPTTGPAPSSWTGEVTRDATGPASVYVFRFGERNVWKVGWAKVAGDRLDDVNRHIPFEALGERWTEYSSVPFTCWDDAYRAEQRVLRALKCSRTAGERVHCDEAELKNALELCLGKTAAVA